MLSNNMLLSSLSDKLRLLEPENILKRGYSITTKNGKIVSNSNELMVNDIVETQIFKGSFKSKVQSI